MGFAIGISYRTGSSIRIYYRDSLSQSLSIRLRDLYRVPYSVT